MRSVRLSKDGARLREGEELQPSLSLQLITQPRTYLHRTRLRFLRYLDTCTELGLDFLDTCTEQVIFSRK